MVVAPFRYQPTRNGLRALSGLGAATGIGPPVGAGAGPGAEIGATQGAQYGSVAGPVGAAIGAVIGAIGGAIAGSINKKDPEQYNFDQAVAIWQQQPDAVYNIGNKYLPLAGMFDLNLKNPKIPIYQKYGRMGEERFTGDLVRQVYSAAQSGQITASDTAITIFNRIIQPWINSWGYGPMNDPHADLVNRLLIGMIWDYVTGSAPQVWRARSGDLPGSFTNLPAFSLPAAAAPPPPPAAAPAPAPAPAPVAPVGSPAQAPIVVAGTGGSLQTSEGTFSFLAGNVPNDAPLALNGQPIAGAGVGMTVVNGVLYVVTSSGQWYARQNGTWNASGPPPNGSQVMGTVNQIAQFNISTGKVPAPPPIQLLTDPGSVVNVPTPTPLKPPAATPATPVATSSSGTPITQGDLQNMVSQLASQGATAQQAFTSALQSLQAQGVQPTPQVQQAVQSAVQSTPAPTAAGVSAGGWLGIGAVVLTLMFAGARPVGTPRRRRSKSR